MFILAAFFQAVSFWKEFLGSFLIVLLIIYAFFKYKLSYWERRGFKSVKGKIPFGSLVDFVLARKSIAGVVFDIYKQNQGHKYVGYYSLWTPTLMVRDPELIKSIIVKDFECFNNRGMYYNPRNDRLSSHLFSLSGPTWKPTRAKLNPIFSNSKIKTHHATIKICSSQLQDYLMEFLDKNIDVINFKEAIARHSINIIANTAVGIEGHCLKQDSQLREVTLKSTLPTRVQAFRFAMAAMSKDFAKFARLRFTPKDVEEYFLDLTKNIIEYRTKNDVVYNDFMQLLLEMWDRNLTYENRSKSDDDFSLSTSAIAAQIFFVIMASNESTSSAVGFALYELAYNQEIQEKARNEVDAVGSFDDLTYEKLSKLKYLEMILYESLRKYPPANFLMRECVRDYRLPDGKILEKGTNVTVSLFGIHNDPAYFPDPERFNPERFDKGSQLQEIKSFTYLPFGAGPRHCMGERQAIMQMKITMFALVSKFRFEMAEKTMIPPVLDPMTFVTQPKGGMHLRIVSREKD